MTGREGDWATGRRGGDGAIGNVRSVSLAASPYLRVAPLLPVAPSLSYRPVASSSSSS